MVRATVSKFQTYSTGEGWSLSAFGDNADVGEAVKLDKEKVVVLTEDEYREIMDGGIDVNKITAIKYAKELIEEAHQKLCEYQDEAISEVEPMPLIEEELPLWRVVGNHPTLARPDKYGMKKHDARVYAESLEPLGYENIQVLEEGAS